MIKRVGLLLFCFSLASCVEYAEPQSYLLPDGFTGAFVVVFNQKEGTPKEYENGRRIYRIPKNGVLFTQFDIDYRVFTPESSKTYYVDSLGKKKDSLLLLIKHSDRNANYILDSYSGSFYINADYEFNKDSTGYTYYDNSKADKIPWIYRTIGKISMRDSLRGVGTSFVDKVGERFSPLKKVEEIPTQ